MRIILVLLLSLLTGCVNNYAKFYQGTQDARLIPGYIHSDRPVSIFITSDPENEIRNLVIDGYMQVGISSFNADSDSMSQCQIIAQAKKIGAHIVLAGSEYTHTVSGAAPIIMPNTSTSYSTGTATAYGSGGPVTAYGSGVSTTYGSQTTMMPYSIPRFNFYVLYFAKRSQRIGFIAVPLDDKTRQRIQPNSGIRVDLVIENSGALKADILSDDVILKFNETPIRSVEHYQELLETYCGSEVRFTIDREGTTLVKSVPFNRF